MSAARGSLRVTWPNLSFALTFWNQFLNCDTQSLKIVLMELTSFVGSTSSYSRECCVLALNQPCYRSLCMVPAKTWTLSQDHPFLYLCLISFVSSSLAYTVILRPPSMFRKFQRIFLPLAFSSRYLYVLLALFPICLTCRLLLLIAFSHLLEFSPLVFHFHAFLWATVN